MSISRETSTTTRATTAISTRTTTPKPHSHSRETPSWPLLAAIAWTLFALGGLYDWTLVPLGLFVLAGLALVRPRLFGVTSELDALLILAIVAIAAQLIPLPAHLRNTLSPHAIELERALRLDAGGPDTQRPLSVDPGATAVSLAYFCLTVAVFWIARGILDRGSMRLIVRRVAWIGFVVSVVAVVQLNLSPLHFYGFWSPDDASARPFGPFVNRNHMATWLLLAIPLAWGYVMTRTRARMHGHTSRASRRVALIRALDATTVWQAGAVVTMVSTLFLSLSRSGAIGLGAGVLAGFLFTFARFGHIRVRWLVGVAAFVVIIATFLANLVALTTRFSEALQFGTQRSDIWRQTLTLVQDFKVAGTGAGTFAQAMLFHQQGDRSLLYNQAHNQYLQVAAEGGLLVGVPMLLALVMFATMSIRALRRDETARFWMRAGAASSLVAVGVQSLWETGLRMPANGVLFAVCAALAVHEAHGETSEQE